eukprot:36760-Eustigmatos_ZCMA.PRE.1
MLTSNCPRWGQPFYGFSVIPPRPFSCPWPASSTLSDFSRGPGDYVPIGSACVATTLPCASHLYSVREMC